MHIPKLSSLYIWNAKGNVLIKGSNFTADDFHFICSYSTWLYISYDSKIVVAIKNSRFNARSCLFGCDCYGAVIKTSNDDFEFSHFLFENTNFSNYFVGLSLTMTSIVKKPVIKLLNVNADNNVYGINILMNGGANGYAGTVSVLSSTFMNNVILYIQADTVNISSTVLNYDGCIIVAHTVNVSSVTFLRSYL